MYDHEEKLTDEQKQRMIEEYRAKQERMHQTGKIIVFTIAIIYIVLSIAEFIVSMLSIPHSAGPLTGLILIFWLIVQIAWSIALCCGVSWVRYLFVIGAVIGAFVIVSDMLLGEILHTSAPAIVLAAALIVYQIACAAVLFASKSVSEFLYSQKNG